MQVGTTKDQGLYSKPSVAVHQEALAAGTLPQYSTITWPRAGVQKFSKNLEGGGGGPVNF